MAGATYIRGPIRTVLYSVENLVIASGTTAMVLANVKTTPYTRFTGFSSTIGSMTMQYRMAISSMGTSTDSSIFAVTSSVVINSGTLPFNMENFGTQAEFRITASNSQVAKAILIVGEPVR